jgi:hypothetical protein
LSNPTTPNEAVIEEANCRLIEGLESCRAVVKNYQSMLAGDPETAAEPTCTELHPPPKAPEPRKPG